MSMIFQISDGKNVQYDRMKRQSMWTRVTKVYNYFPVLKPFCQYKYSRPEKLVATSEGEATELHKHVSQIQPSCYFCFRY